MACECRTCKYGDFNEYVGFCNRNLNSDFVLDFFGDCEFYERKK